MAASSLIRWGGLAAVLGGVLVMVASSFSYYSSMGPPLTAASYALVAAGITSTYLYLRRPSGRFGLSGTVGFYMCVFAFVVTSIGSLGVLLNVWGVRWLETLGAVNILMILGTVMFGVAILRDGRLPRVGVWLLMAYAATEVGVIAAMAVSGYTLPNLLWTVPAILLGLGWVWLGYALWSESGTSAGRPSRV